MNKYLVFDIGGTKTKYAHMDEDANIIDKGSIDTIKDSLENLIETMGKIYDQYEANLKGIAVSLPGVIDSNTGHMYFGGSLTFNQDINFVEKLKARCPTKITVENDAKSAALAELWKGSMQGIKHGAVITLGTGVGGGVIIDGQVHKGHGFYAGEFSHIRTNAKEVSDFRYFFGASGSVIGLTHSAACKKGIEKMDGYSFFELAKNGDEEILEMLDNYTKNIAIQILNLQAIISPEKIAIGGGISEQPLLIEFIRKNVDLLIKQENQGRFKMFIPKIDIQPCKFKNDSNLIGTLYHHLHLTK